MPRRRRVRQKELFMRHVEISLAKFDRIWSLALSGRLKYGRVVFTKPRYGKALVTSASFSTEPDD